MKINFPQLRRIFLRATLLGTLLLFLALWAWSYQHRIEIVHQNDHHHKMLEIAWGSLTFRWGDCLSNYEGWLFEFNSPLIYGRIWPMFRSEAHSFLGFSTDHDLWNDGVVFWKQFSIPLWFFTLLSTLGVILSWRSPHHVSPVHAFPVQPSLIESKNSA